MSALLRKPMWPPSGKLWQQNLQFSDAYGEALVGVATQAVAPNGWGFTRLVLEEAALAEGIVRVVQAEGRFRSGAPLLVLPGTALARALPPERDAARVAVSIGLAKVSDDAPNVTDEPREVAAVRYVRSRSGDGPVLRGHFRLLFNDEGSEAYERMPLASVSWLGRPWFDPWFAPPMIRLLPDSAVHQGVRQVVGALAARHGALLEERDARPFDLRAFDPVGAPHLLLLSALGRALMLLDHPDLPSLMTPGELHEALSALLGDLEGLDGRWKGTASRYGHEAPGPGFRSLLERLLALIPDVARSAHRVFPFERRDQWNYVLRIEDADLLRRRVYLVASGVADGWAAPYLPAYARIGSDPAVAAMLGSATAGVPIGFEVDPPPFLPSSALHSPFRIDVRSHLWGDALQSGSLRVHVPNAPAGLDLALYVLPSEGR